MIGTRVRVSAPVVVFTTAFQISHIFLKLNNIFMLLAFNLSNGVTDTLESSTILIYLIKVKGIYTQRVALIKTGY
jgi:hypothetical protein